MILGRKSILLPSQIKANDGDIQMISAVNCGPSELKRRETEDLIGGTAFEETAELCIPGAEIFIEVPQCADDDSEAKRRLGIAKNGFGLLVLPLRISEPSRDGQENIIEAETGMHMKLWCKPNFDVAYAFLDVVPGQLVCGPLESFCVLEHSTGVGKALEILRQVGVSGLEDQLV